MIKISGGGAKGKFYSGIGSHDTVYIEPYINMIKEFIKQNNIKSVVSLGCGDFYVDRHIINENIHYEGIDIVDRMIAFHNKKYGSTNVHFLCMDIVKDHLPDGDLCLIRQVLQHLDNQEIKIILDKVKKYKYVIITEHVTVKEKAKSINIDKVHGHHIRTYNDSGVYLDEPPYSMESKEILQIPYGDNKTELCSSLIINL